MSFGISLLREIVSSPQASGPGNIVKSVGGVSYFYGNNLKIIKALWFRKTEKK